MGEQDELRAAFEAAAKEAGEDLIRPQGRRKRGYSNLSRSTRATARRLVKLFPVETAKPAEPDRRQWVDDAEQLAAEREAAPEPEFREQRDRYEGRRRGDPQHIRRQADRMNRLRPFLGKCAPCERLIEETGVGVPRCPHCGDGRCPKCGKKELDPAKWFVPKRKKRHRKRSVKRWGEGPEDQDPEMLRRRSSAPVWDPAKEPGYATRPLRAGTPYCRSCRQQEIAEYHGRDVGPKSRNEYRIAARERKLPADRICPTHGGSPVLESNRWYAGGNGPVECMSCRRKRLNRASQNETSA